MDFSKATDTELLTIMFWDTAASAIDQEEAARVYLKRKQKKRKPYQQHNQHLKKVYPR